jgi:hypothetical protein
VPKPRIRKIEPNPAISIQSFILEEEMIGLSQPQSPKGGASDKKPEGQVSPKTGSRPQTEAQNPPLDDNNIAGWSYIKKPNTHF